MSPHPNNHLLQEVEGIVEVTAFLAVLFFFFVVGLNLISYFIATYGV